MSSKRPFQIKRFAELASTNTWALAHLFELKEGDVIWALSQTAGRGRRGRSWLSESGGSLTFSIVHDLDANRHWVNVAQVAALTLAKLLRDLGAAAEVKWPNDVLIEKQKVAGILAETSQHHLVLGIGVNIETSRSLLDKAGQRATSLKEQIKNFPNTESFLNLFLERWDHSWRALISSGFSFFLDEWRNLSPMSGHQVEVRTEEGGPVYSAKLLDILPDGRLKLEKESGEIVFLSTGDLI